MSNPLSASQMLQLAIAYKKAQGQIRKFGWWLLDCTKAGVVGLYHLLTYPAVLAYQWTVVPAYGCCFYPGGLIYNCKETCLGCCDGCYICCHPFAGQGSGAGGSANLSFGAGAGVGRDSLRV